MPEVGAGSRYLVKLALIIAVIFANCSLPTDPVPIKCSAHVCVPTPFEFVVTGK